MVAPRGNVKQLWATLEYSWEAKRRRRIVGEMGRYYDRNRKVEEVWGGNWYAGTDMSDAQVGK